MGEHLITYVDQTGAKIQASVWSKAPGGWWVIPLEGQRRFVKVRLLNHVYRIDER